MTSKTKAKPNRDVLQAAVTLMLAGVQNNLPTGTTSLPIDGQSLTPTQIATQLQAYLTAVANLATAKQMYANEVVSMKATIAATRALMEALTAWVKLQFGSTNVSALANFGVPVKAPKTTSVASKAAGQAKRAATLEAKQSASEAASAAANPPITVTVGANGVQLATPAATPVPAAPSAK